MGKPKIFSDSVTDIWQICVYSFLARLLPPVDCALMAGLYQSFILIRLLFMCKILIALPLNGFSY